MTKNIVAVVDTYFPTTCLPSICACLVVFFYQYIKIGNLLSSNKMSRLRFLLFFCSIYLLRSTAAVGAPASSPGGIRSPRSPTRHHECRAVAQELAGLHLGAGVTIPSDKIHEPNLEICHPSSDVSKSCCSRTVEHKLHHIAIERTRKTITDTSSDFKSLLTTKMEFYKDHFLTLLSFMSNKTQLLLTNYLNIPSTPAMELVEGLTENLTSYINGQEIDIKSSVEQFFDALFSSVYFYTIHNPGLSTISRSYEDCMISSRQDLLPSPFGEKTKQLSQGLLKSFSSVRSLLLAFELSIDVINTTDHLRFSDQCSKALMRLTFCSKCDGHTQIKSCHSLCRNVISGCLAQAIDIDSHWNLFVESVKQLVVGMRGTSNSIEEVAKIFPSKISECVAHSLSTLHRYNMQIVDKCGNLSIPLKDDETLSSDIQNLNNFQLSISSLPDSKLHPTIELFFKNLYDAQWFYRKLPDTICSSESIAPKNNETCWNGTSLGLYTKPVPNMSLRSQNTSNPEMTISEHPELIILKTRLDNMTKKLHSRFMMPYRFHLLQAEMSGSGNYDYSGDGDDDDDDGDDDGEDDFDSGSGPSGDPVFPTDETTTESFEEGGEPPQPSVVISLSTADFDFTDQSTTVSKSPYIKPTPPKTVPPKYNSFDLSTGSHTIISAFFFVAFTIQRLLLRI